MPRVGDHGLRIEGVAPGALGDRHAKIAVQAESRDAHAGIVLVLRGQVDIVVVMVVVAEAEAVAVAMVVVVVVVVVVVMVMVTVASCHFAGSWLR